MTPKIFIIMVSYNNFSDCDHCIGLLETLSIQYEKVILVDNASSDSAGPKIAQKYDHVHLIQNSANLGFAKAMNMGIKFCLNNNAEYVLLLNADVTFKQDFLEEAMQLAISDSTIGVIGCKTFFYDTPDKLICAGYEQDRSFKSFFKSGARCKPRGFGQIDQGQYAEPCQVYMVAGSAMIVSCQVFQKGVFLPECYFFRMEDFDFCLQVKKVNLKIVMSPGFKLWHKIGQKGRKTDSGFIYNNFRNTFLFKYRNYNKMKYLIWLIVYSSYLYASFLIFKMIKNRDKVLIFELARLAFTDHRNKKYIEMADIEYARTIAGA